MFKKISNFFFEEVDEEENDDFEEEEEVIVAPKKNQNVHTPIIVNKPNIDITLEPKPKVKQEESINQNSNFIDNNKKVDNNKIEFYDVAEKPKRYIDIDEKARLQQAPTPLVTHSKVSLAENQRRNYEFTSVISPMFGVKPSKINDGNPIHPLNSASNLRTDSSLGNVISPMYGKVKPEIKKTEVEVDVVKKNEPVEKAERSGIHEEVLPPKYKLDDILNYEKKVELEEDTHQFSLFDDFNELVESQNEDDLDIAEFFNNSNK